MIALIAAVAENNVIGAKNDLPWNIPEDLARFKKLTTGKTVLMGRNTFQSVMKRLGKPLPNRTSAVLTRDPNEKFPDGVLTYISLEAALRDFKEKDLYVIGGGEIYAQTIAHADKLYITHVERSVDGDVYFPKFRMEDWSLAEEEKHEGYRFATYERKNQNPRL